MGFPVIVPMHGACPDHPTMLTLFAEGLALTQEGLILFWRLQRITQIYSHSTKAAEQEYTASMFSFTKINTIADARASFREIIDAWNDVEIDVGDPANCVTAALMRTGGIGAGYLTSVLRNLRFMS